MLRAVERWAAERYLAWGVTTVRISARRARTPHGVKNDFDLGSVLGPRMLTSGAMIDGRVSDLRGGDAVRTAAECAGP